MPDKTKKQIKRRKDGTFAPGVSGNPAGRPLKGESWKELFKQELEKLIRYPNKNSSKITQKRAIVSRLISEALAGNVKAIREIIERTATLDDLNEENDLKEIIRLLQLRDGYDPENYDPESEDKNNVS